MSSQAALPQEAAPAPLDAEGEQALADVFAAQGALTRGEARALAAEVRGGAALLFRPPRVCSGSLTRSSSLVGRLAYSGCFCVAGRRQGARGRGAAGRHRRACGRARCAAGPACLPAPLRAELGLPVMTGKMFWGGCERDGTCGGCAGGAGGCMQGAVGKWTSGAGAHRLRL